MIKTRTFAKSCVLTVLKMAIRERLKYPPKVPGENYEDVDIARLIADNASALEEAAYQASLGKEVSLEEKRLGNQQIWQVETSGKRTTDEVATFQVYITMIAQFVIHLSPAFYTGRHSFWFRDMLINGRFVKLGNDITEVDVEELWPEIYANELLDVREFEQISFTREVEISIAIKGLVDLIETCCMSGENGICSYEQQVEKIKQQRIFEEGSTFAEAKQFVCFARGDAVWHQGTNKIILPCSEKDAICPIIPEEAKDVYAEMNQIHYFSTCVNYEDFLMSFSDDIDNMESDIPDPTGVDERVNYNAAAQIRKAYSKEMKMMQVYLDLLQK